MTASSKRRYAITNNASIYVRRKFECVIQTRAARREGGQGAHLALSPGLDGRLYTVAAPGVVS